MADATVIPFPTTVPVVVPPRFRAAPLFLSSAGQDCVDLYHGAMEAVARHPMEAIGGVAPEPDTLDDWQQDVLIGSLAERGAPGARRWEALEVGLIVPRQNGKGSILEARELFGMELDPLCKLVTHTAHRADTAGDHFKRMKRIYLRCPDLRAGVVDNGRGVDGEPSGILKGNGTWSITLVNGSHLAFKTRVNGSGRGFSGDLLVYDEAYHLYEMDDTLPALSARPNPQVWYTSSAPLPGPESDVLRGIIRQGRELARSIAASNAAADASNYAPLAVAA